MTSRRNTSKDGAVMKTSCTPNKEGWFDSRIDVSSTKGSLSLLLIRLDLVFDKSIANNCSACERQCKKKDMASEPSLSERKSEKSSNSLRKGDSFSKQTRNSKEN